jgi:hypothetical protein
MERQADHEVQHCVDRKCRAPAMRIEQELRQRPEHRAREAAKQRESGDGLAIRRSRDRVQRGERRIVQAARHRDSCHDESGRQRHGAVRDREQRERDGAERGAATQGEPPAMRVDQLSRGRRRNARYEQPRGEAAEHCNVADAEIAAHRGAQHGDRIVETAPRNDLRDAEHGHHPA